MVETRGVSCDEMGEAVRVVVAEPLVLDRDVAGVEDMESEAVESGETAWY